MPIVLLEIADQLGVSIAVPEQAESKTLTADYDDADALQVLQELAKRMATSVVYRDGVIAFVSPDDEEKSFVVLRSGYIQVDIFADLLKSQLGDKARVEKIDDRVIVSAPQQLIARAIEIEKYAQTGADGWLLTVQVVTLSDSIKRDLGLDWSVNGSLILSSNNLETLTDSSVFIEAVARATETGVDAELLDTADLYVLEGSTSTLNRGQRIPIPRFTTTIEGATNVSGYEYLNTGFVLSVTANRVPGGVRLHIQPTLSTVTGFVRDAPITQESSITADVIVGDGDWIIMSGLETSRDTDTTVNLPGLPAPIFGTRSTERGTDTLYIMIRAKRVFAAG